MSANASRRHVALNDEPTGDEYTGERRLFRAIVAEAIRDAIGVPCASSREQSQARKLAQIWFKDAGDDFKTVCDLADLDPANVRRNVLDYIMGRRPVPELPQKRQKPSRRQRRRKPANDE